MIFRLPQAGLNLVMERLGIEPNRSISNARTALKQPPAHLYELAVHICTRGPNPQGLVPSDLLSERYPDLLITG